MAGPVRSVLLAALLGLGLAGPGPAAPLDAAAFDSCGTLTDSTDCPDCQGEVVFDTDGYWHGLAQCTRDIRDAWARFGPDQPLDLPGDPQLADFARDQILSALDDPEVRFLPQAGGPMLDFAAAFGPDLQPRQPLAGVALINDRGEAYNGMGQTGLAYFLLQFAAQAEKGGYDRARADAALYRLLGEAALAPVLAPVATGGLTTRAPCALAPELACSWYHSVTRRDWPGAAGGTLNQMLHVLRDLGQIGQMADRQGWDLAVDTDRAVAEGLNQLFLSGGYQGPGTGPDLADFNSQGRDSPAPAVWAWYGFNTLSDRPARGYFLKNAAKNCSYHAHNLQLLGAILTRAREAGLAPEARRAARAEGALPARLAAALRQPDRAPPEVVCTPATRAKIKRALKAWSD